MTLHIYSQGAWHEDAYIVGTTAALVQLRGQIDAVLRGGHGAACKATFFVNDGEGFSCEMRLETEEALHHYAVPYTDEVARDRNAHHAWPTRR
jgi:hypothetical protein